MIDPDEGPNSSFVIICDARGAIEYANPAASNLKSGDRRYLEIMLHSVDGLYVPTRMALRMIGGAEGGEGRLLVIRDAAEPIPAVSYVSSLASNNLVIRMLNGSVDPLFLIDPKTRIVRDCNLAATALFGWSRDPGSTRRIYC